MTSKTTKQYNSNVIEADSSTYHNICYKTKTQNTVGFWRFQGCYMTLDTVRIPEGAVAILTTDLVGEKLTAHQLRLSCGGKSPPTVFAVHHCFISDGASRAGGNVTDPWKAADVVATPGPRVYATTCDDPEELASHSRIRGQRSWRSSLWAAQTFGLRWDAPPDSHLATGNCYGVIF